MVPTISVICPTQGKPTLERMLDSVRDQLLPGDEVLVVVDTHEMTGADFADFDNRLAPYGPQFHAFGYDAGHHDHGHSQINHAMAQARCDYLSFQDDDDVYTPFALAQMREAATAHPDRPLLFRFRSHLGGMVFWLQPGLVRQSCIGGHCLVVPGRNKDKLGQWTDRYEGDYDFIVQTLELWKPVEPVWCDFVIAVARPQEAA